MTHSQRATFSLNKENHIFLNHVGGNNKSSYINKLLDKERQRTLREAILQANIEEAHDSEYGAELKEWDSTLSDGLTNE